MSNLTDLIIMIWILCLRKIMVYFIDRAKMATSTLIQQMLNIQRQENRYGYTCNFQLHRSIMYKISPLISYNYIYLK